MPIRDGSRNVLLISNIEYRETDVNCLPKDRNLFWKLASRALRPPPSDSQF